MKNSMIVLMLAVIIGAIFATISVSYFAQQQSGRGVAMEDLPQLYRPEAKQLGSVVIKTYREYRGNSVWWSFAYFGCLFGSALLSAMAALVLKLELLGDRPKLKNDLAATLATLAALLVTLSTTGDFQRKWYENRVAAGAMENLAYELVKPSAAANQDAILTRIQEINNTRNQGIVGDITKNESKEMPPLQSPAQPGAPSATRH